MFGGAAHRRGLVSGLWALLVATGPVGGCSLLYGPGEAGATGDAAVPESDASRAGPDAESDADVPRYDCSPSPPTASAYLEYCLGEGIVFDDVLGTSAKAAGTSIDPIHIPGAAIEGGGLVIDNLASARGTTSLPQSCNPEDAITAELVVRPASDHSPVNLSRIFELAPGGGQSGYFSVGHVQGEIALGTATPSEPSYRRTEIAWAQGAIQYVAVSLNDSRAFVFWTDGESTSSEPVNDVHTPASWGELGDANYLQLGNDVDDAHPWDGRLYYLSLSCERLSEDQIMARVPLGLRP